MSAKEPAIYRVRNAEVINKAEFRSPILEIALSDTQAKIIKAICDKFGLQFRDLILNNQAFSSGYIRFRRNFDLGYFEALLGVDEILTKCVNTETEQIAWSLSSQIVGILSDNSQIVFKQQALTFNIHCSPENIIYSDFINNINKFVLKNISFSKGASFSIKSPWPGALINIIFDQSFLIEDGLFMLIQVIIDGSIQAYEDLFNNSIAFLKKSIEPSFNIKIKYEGKE
jgi:hypothetical protein